nr:retrovirus-related Pol polyprotein from transposon TNT 1-94 [Tanacetum cinerariifolium]
TDLPECKDDTVTDYSRPEPIVESSPDDAKKRNSSVSETVASPIITKSFVKFVKASDRQSKSKIDETETPKKSPVKYAEQYRKKNKKPNVRGNQRNWNNLKSYQLGPDFVMKKKACFNYGDFNHLAYDCRKRVKRGTTRSQNNTSKIPTHRPVVHRPHEPPMRPMRSNMNVRSQYRAPWVPTINKNFPSVNRKFFTGSRNFPTSNRKFPIASRKFPTGSTKFSTADMGMKGKTVKPSACWVWKPSQDLSNKGLNNNRQFLEKIDDKGYWDNGCSRHMTCNISYLSDYEPFDGGYVSFGQGGCKITRKGTIKTGKLKFKNVYFVKDLKYNLFSVSQICDNKNSVLFTDSKSIVLGRDFKMLDDANVLLRTPRFTWTFFLKSKDETSGILKKFIFEIDNLKDLRVKIIRCDNGGEFQNKEMNDFCSQKGIKREFINARTPRQNGVAEKRNRTLIEVARTMLADSKLHVTFWAEAVNTGCYVQKRVLVNNSHNKTPYELFNGKTPAIGFLKPFGCHVMILNTLDNLGNFKAKRDEGYFIGYSMSSKAFRVFNKRTKRVKENLHIEFLENKAIKKGAGLNWLFDIDSLTKSMNYVPVVDTGTNSTNFLGTKDVACQEVEKDVSTLRYIALPNWAHDAFLESSSSKSQDDCNTNVPESSGNTNPTATSTIPPTDQVETLTVESPIPTASSPVPTDCFTDSQEPSKPKKISDALQDPSWVEAMQKELLQFKIQKGLKNKKDERGIVIKNKARLVPQGHTQEEWINYDEVFAPVTRIEAIRLFLAYASFMGFTGR